MKKITSLPNKSLLYKNRVVILHGQRVQIEESIDINKDGKKDHIERVSMPQQNTLSINNDSTIKDTIQEMNRMDFDPDTNISEITKMSVINNDIESNAIARLIALRSMRMYTKEAEQVFLSKLAINISLKGIGRAQAVEVATGQREKDIEKQSLIKRGISKLGPKRGKKDEAQ